MPKVFEDYSDIRNKAWCYHCGTSIGENSVNREHIPTKSILTKPFPRDLPVAYVCEKCNSGFSLDEEYFAAFMSAVLSGSTEPDKQKLDTGRKLFSKNKSLAKRIEHSRKEHQTVGGDTEVVWQPEYERISKVIIKNARGHVYFENGEPVFGEPSDVRIFPLQTASQEELDRFFPCNQQIANWPEVGSRWMQRLIEDPNFDAFGFYVLQPYIYRYRLDFEDCLRVRIIFYEYLAADIAWQY